MSLYIGLMSGTSADGVDAALVDFSGLTPSPIALYHTPYPETLKQQITALYTPGDNELDRMGVLDRVVGEFFADCVSRLLARSGVSRDEITAIGSHGQTVRHRPRHSAEAAFTLQIGDPSTIAQNTGINTIADFRRRDVAAGGQGAPLAPAFHRAVFASNEADRAVVNIGGIANITVLGSSGITTGLDTGPGNGLMDAWINLHRGKPYDDGGQWAASGKPHPELLEQLLSHDYFALSAPKSTGREEFSLPWLQQQLKAWPSLAPEDVQASLLQLTARSIAQVVSARVSGNAGIYVCGGGAFNPQLMHALQAALPEHRVNTTEALGIAPDWVEAIAFAWLAMRTWQGLSGNEPAVTGAKQAVILGGIYKA